jgi:hypothetical protein
MSQSVSQSPPGLALTETDVGGGASNHRPAGSGQQGRVLGKQSKARLLRLLYVDVVKLGFLRLTVCDMPRQQNGRK